MIDTLFIKNAITENPYIVGNPSRLNYNGFSIDSRTISPGECFIAVKGGKFDGHDFLQESYNKGVRCFIIDKKHKNRIKNIVNDSVYFTVPDTITALGSLAASYRNSSFSNIFAITGSSGKTTTRELIVRILSKKYNVHTAKRNFNNEIGFSLTLLEAPLSTHIIVVELGMNHKGEIKKLSKIAKPLAGMITNVGYAHIGFLGSLDAIAEAKSEIFEGISPYGFIFLNRDDHYYEYLKKMADCEVIDFGLSDIKIIENLGLDGYILSYNGRTFKYPLPGSHNIYNLAAALKTALFYQVDFQDIIPVIEGFVTVSGRTEIIRKGFTVIRDFYNANPSSMKAALEVLSVSSGRRIAVIGDMLELGNYSQSLHKEIGNYISATSCADIVFAIGENSREIIQSIHNPGIEASWFDTKEGMIDALVNTVKKNDIILLKASRSLKLEDASVALSNLDL